ncbi:MAG TPA: hypothetical protein P5140_05830 [Methanofastidiosum sp.]|nr:hypothetical protein [Methanofastidiosum sp.]
MSGSERLSSGIDRILSRRYRGGLGRNRGNKPGAGPFGKCVCPDCGATVSHRTGVPCYTIECPKCGTRMRRE